MSHSAITVTEKAGEYTILMDGGRSGGENHVSFSVWREGACLHSVHHVFRKESDMARAWEVYRRGAKNGNVGLPGGIPVHDCMNHPVPYESDGPLGHGFECGICGAFLQAG